MTGKEFVDWMERMGFSDTASAKTGDTAAAKALGKSRATIIKYKTEGTPLDVALACAALVRGIKPWPQ